jgi:hypothetical protein
MSRLVAVRSLYVFLAISGVAVAQEPPPLEPPSLEPPRAEAPQTTQPANAPKPVRPKPATAAPTTAPKPEVRPMLAIPGVTAPASRPFVASRPPIIGPVQPGNPAVSPPPDALPLPSEFRPARSPSGPTGFPLNDDPSPPSLDALPPRSGPPALRGPSNAVGVPRPRASTPPSGETIPLTIEPLDEEPSTGPRSAGRTPPPGMSNGRSTGGTRPSRPEPDDEPIDRRPTPRRGPGVLGRLFGLQPAPPPPPREEARTRDSKSKRDPGAESDPDPDLIARRRIERQIRATLGDKVRSVEVQVTGRNVVVIAQPSRFWLRRSVRRSLETLPALQGYRARIEISE